TVGRISALPGSTNQVPGEARLSLDVRAPGQAALERVRDGVHAAARAEGVETEWMLETADPGCVFDDDLRLALHAAARAEGSEAIDMAAYAGPDAGVLARHLPAVRRQRRGRARPPPAGRDAVRTKSDRHLAQPRGERLRRRLPRRLRSPG